MADKIQAHKGQAPEKLGREAFGERFREQFYDPRFDDARDAIASLEAIAWRNYEEARKAPRTMKAGPEFADPDYDLSVEWNAARERLRRRNARSRTRRRARACWSSAARRATTAPARARSRRPSASRGLVRGRLARARHRGRLPRPEPAHLRLRPPHPSVQGLRVDRDAALPLAVQLLSEPRARPDPRLDERDLRALGRARTASSSSRRRTGTDAERAQADDRPPRLRRRRQSRPDLDPRQEARRGEGDRARPAGTIRSTSPAASTAWWCTATSPASRARGARCRDWLDWMGLIDAGSDGPARPLHRLLRALRDQPRRARPRRGGAGGDAQRGPRGRQRRPAFA